MIARCRTIWQSYGGLVAATGVLMMGVFLFVPSASATSSLMVRPLSYEAQLQKGERKTGYIDISNPSDQVVTVTTDVRAFRQLNNSGELAFYDSEAIEKGVTSDLRSFTLGPLEAQRMVFELDGAKLPEGDVFAVIFFTINSKDSTPLAQIVRVGTLFTIENNTPGSRKAEVTKLSVDFLQMGSTIDGEYSIKNTAKVGQVSGFTPLVDLKLWPFGHLQQQDSSLLFAGHERSNKFLYNTSLPGLYRFSAGYDNSIKSHWVLVLPTWSIWVCAMVPLAGLVLFAANRYRKQRVIRRDKR